MKLPLSFYLEEDVIKISKELLGKFLCTNIHEEGLTSGMIVETEAYAGVGDKASHAHGGRRTSRTGTMYEEGGIAYVYLIYGFHYLFNIITNIRDIPHAILVRAVQPADGMEIMLHRRKLEKAEYRLTSGPGLVCKALGITKEQNGISLLEDTVWLEDRGVAVPEKQIVASPRVNVAYAKEDAELPWRFRVKNNPWTSKAK
jgi:DNA-3-methyladenine glycosylase